MLWNLDAMQLEHHWMGESPFDALVMTHGNKVVQNGAYRMFMAQWFLTCRSFMEGISHHKQKMSYPICNWSHDEDIGPRFNNVY